MKDYSTEEWDVPLPPCTEPDGNEQVAETGLTAHATMLQETGQCPWCGQEER
jgi:hypothetical protein